MSDNHTAILQPDRVTDKPESKLPTGIKPKIASIIKTSRCPYHEPIIQLVRSPLDNTRGYAGIDRFLKEGPDQQYAVFLRPDDGLCSLAKNCTCGQRSEQNVSRL